VINFKVNYLEKLRYKRFTYCAYGIIFFNIALIVSFGILSRLSNAHSSYETVFLYTFIGILLLAAVSGFSFLYYLFRLTRAVKGDAFVDTVLCLTFHVFGFYYYYFKMYKIARKEGWV
jgi:hypothetical protein